MAEIIVEPIENYALSKSNRPQATFSKVGVVGFGDNGRNIARMVSANGIDVVIVELSPDKIEQGMKQLAIDLDEMINHWGMTASEKRAILSRIKGYNDYSALTGCDVVIEAILSRTREQNVSVRKEIFKEVEKYITPDAIIATNSSTLVITELSNELQHPERCVSFHFIAAAHDARVVEVARGIYTSDATFEKVKLFAQMLDKVLIEVIESPGVISTRLVVPLINEACEILMEGVGSMEEIDCTMSMGFGLSQGPFAMADNIGLDRLLRWCETLYQEFGELRYKASPMIKKLVRANQLGRKTRKGFYEYDANGQRITKQRFNIS